MVAKLVTLLFALFVVSTAAPAYSETVEQYYRRLYVAPADGMIHPEGRYALLQGDQIVIIPAEQILAAHRELKTLGVETKILELQILNTYEVANMVSVALRLRFQQTVGGKTVTSEALGQELLLKKDDTYVSIFGLSMLNAK